jgi:hypothetical protein
MKRFIVVTVLKNKRLIRYTSTILAARSYSLWVKLAAIIPGLAAAGIGQ